MYIEMNPTGLTLTDLICVANRKRSEDTGFANVKDNVFHNRLRLAAERATVTKFCFLDREHRARFQKALHRVRGNDKNLIAQLFVLTATESLWSASDDAVGKSSISYLDIDYRAFSENDYLFDGWHGRCGCT